MSVYIEKDLEFCPSLREKNRNYYNSKNYNSKNMKLVTQHQQNPFVDRTGESSNTFPLFGGFSLVTRNRKQENPRFYLISSKYPFLPLLKTYINQQSW